MYRLPRFGLVSLFVLTGSACNTFVQPLPAPPSEFVNFETPHVSPIDLAPGGKTLLAVNTADNRLELFDLSGAMPFNTASVPVGLDPVSVRARSDDEAWVVNHVSDSVSVVSLSRRTVVRTLLTGDEPTDVVFAAGLAFVCCSQVNQVWVFNLADLDASPTVLDIAGEDPRALAVSPDGSKVYAAVFESGNKTTAIDIPRVSDEAGPYGGQNPPPNKGDEFFPGMRPELSKPPRVGQIVKKNETIGEWMDDNGRVWPKALVTWDVHDHDIAVIDTAALNVSYVTGLMNLNMQLAVRPDGKITVVGTDATNEIRFEPNLVGRFVHSMMAVVDPADGSKQIVDLNPHLADAYGRQLSTVAADVRAQSLADPRGIAWSSDGSTAYITGMGSNNVAVNDANGKRLAKIEVGEGPTGLALDEARDRLYVLNKFEATISVVSLSGQSETGRVAMFDPTPAAIKTGRPLLYDARRTSGLGVTACASCHADARMDQLAWDLGDPSGEVKPMDQTCQQVPLLITTPCEDFHPMKGPMMTQTLQDIVGTEPLHWRGDRKSLAAFNPAFVGLLGRDAQLTDEEMARFEAFLSTVRIQPSPNRNLDNSLKERVAGGDPRAGEQRYRTGRHDGGTLSCIDCHFIESAGTNHEITPRRSLRLTQSIKVPQLRNVLEKPGFDRMSQENSVGFGYSHDGRFATLVEFLEFTVFTFDDGEAGMQQRRDVVSFVYSFDTGTHPAVGAQVTLDAGNYANKSLGDRLDLFRRLADAQAVGLVAKGARAGSNRGFAYLGGGVWQSDRAGERVMFDDLRKQIGDETMTFTVVPLGSQTRIGIDRDEDGLLDGDDLTPAG